ncbi:hypothetical protein [Metabacillus malikii]|uniref:Uncharacterized protein n=1 Tax=Metabacillus malikii TaxID=1504265 RepID=A0ABT9ZBW1_9BACI|nr:hypothetical protein [Metabacillus malikii]MDQ0229750.1 hypothetical protein [Metabacillus malikii]
MSELEKDIKGGILSADEARSNLKFVNWEIFILMAIVGITLGIKYQSFNHFLLVIPIFILFIFLLRFSIVYFLFTVIFSLVWGLILGIISYAILSGVVTVAFVPGLVSLIIGIIVFAFSYSMHKNI